MTDVKPSRRAGAFVAPDGQDTATAMAEGRALSRSIAAYLEALETHRRRRGRRRTTGSIDKQLAAIETALGGAGHLKRLALVQERLDLLAERHDLQHSPGLWEYEEDFVRVAPLYSQRNGITYRAWRELGVPASVLKRAGISRA